MNIFNSLLPQLVKYDVHTTRKINSIHAIFYHILSLYLRTLWRYTNAVIIIIIIIIITIAGYDEVIVKIKWCSVCLTVC